MNLVKKNIYAHPVCLL